MRARKGCRPLTGIACCLALLACSDEAVEMSPAVAQTGGEAQAEPLRLDLGRRIAVHPIDVAEPERQRFVQVAVGEVVNPRLIRLMIEVRYRPPGGPDELLGTISPFPPDRAGTYTLPTRGSLRPGGAIVLSLISLDQVGPADEVRIDVRAISFRTE
jgi:hypothetical protein